MKDDLRGLRLSQEVALFTQLCNIWWKRYFLPAQSLVLFAFMLIPLYFSITSYDGHLPFYVYAVYPAIGVVTLSCTIVIYAQLAHVHIASFQILKSLRASSNMADSCAHRTERIHLGAKRSTTKGLNWKYPGGKKQVYIVKTEIADVGNRKISPAAYFYAPKRRGLYIARPSRVEVGDFGHYFKTGAASKIISEVFTYLVILLRLRELRLSDLQ